MHPDVEKALGGRVRVRVGGLLLADAEGRWDRGDEGFAPASLLLLEHEGLFDGEQAFWTPPGGGVDFGESLTETLVREVEEESGLSVRPGPLAYTLDFVRPPLHAVSFYFRCFCDADGLGPPWATIPN